MLGLDGDGDAVRDRGGANPNGLYPPFASTIEYIIVRVQLNQIGISPARFLWRSAGQAIYQFHGTNSETSDPMRRFSAGALALRIS